MLLLLPATKTISWESASSRVALKNIWCHRRRRRWRRLWSRRASSLAIWTRATRSIRLDFLIDRYTSHRQRHRQRHGISLAYQTRLKQPLWCQRLTPKKCKLLMDTNTNAPCDAQARTNTLSQAHSHTHTPTRTQSSHRESCNSQMRKLFRDCKIKANFISLTATKKGQQKDGIHQGIQQRVREGWHKRNEK